MQNEALYRKKILFWSRQAGRAAWEERREQADQALVQSLVLLMFCAVFMELG